MDLSLIQKDILITLISLYHQYSHPIKGEEIADIIRRNPGTVRNQMQALKALGLVDGVPGPKGGYHPTSRAYTELHVTADDSESEVAILRNGEVAEGVRVNEIDFTTLTHADLCHALIKVIGNVRVFEVGDKVTIGPTPVNKLLIKGEVFGKDEINSVLLISTSEMTSLSSQTADPRVYDESSDRSGNGYDGCLCDEDAAAAKDSRSSGDRKRAASWHCYPD